MIVIYYFKFVDRRQTKRIERVKWMMMFTVTSVASSSHWSSWSSACLCPLKPRHTVIVHASLLVVAAVQVEVRPVIVPPGTMVPLCTWTWWPLVVVLVSSAKLHADMVRRQWITFRQFNSLSYTRNIVRWISTTWTNATLRLYITRSHGSVRVL